MAKLTDRVMTFWARTESNWPTRKSIGPTMKSIPPVGWCLWLITVFFVACLLFGLARPSPRHVLIPYYTQLLFPDTVRHFQAEKIQSHNANLMNFLQANLARASNDLAVMANTKSQTRMFYVLIAAALISVLSLKQVKWNVVTVIGPVFLIVAMYGLEIHQDDLNTRSTNGYYVEVHALAQLVDLHPNDPIWYVEDGRLVTAMDSSLNKTSRIRKCLTACNPTLDQCILYVLPFLFAFATTYWRTRDIWKTNE
jgi:hypothetical protein